METKTIKEVSIQDLQRLLTGAFDLSSYGLNIKGYYIELFRVCLMTKEPEPKAIQISIPTYIKQHPPQYHFGTGGLSAIKTESYRSVEIDWAALKSNFEQACKILLK